MFAAKQLPADITRSLARRTGPFPEKTLLGVKSVDTARDQKDRSGK
jgi:hypothetical protein